MTALTAIFCRAGYKYSWPGLCCYQAHETIPESGLSLGSVHLFKTLFTQGVPATGAIIETRKNFPAALKNSKEWAKGKERGAMRWEQDAPCLALHWIDNKVVSLLTTIDNADDRVLVNKKTKTAGLWSTKVGYQPKTVSNYNKYINAVDRSDQILATNNVFYK